MIHWAINNKTKVHYSSFNIILKYYVKLIILHSNFCDINFCLMEFCMYVFFFWQLTRTQVMEFNEPQLHKQPGTFIEEKINSDFGLMRMDRVLNWKLWLKCTKCVNAMALTLLLT